MYGLGLGSISRSPRCCIPYCNRYGQGSRIFGHLPKQHSPCVRDTKKQSMVVVQNTRRIGPMVDSLLG